MKYIRALILFLFVAATVHAMAAKCAVVDSEKVYNSSKIYKDFKRSWNQENVKYQKEIEFYENQIAAFDKQLNSNNSNLSADARQKLKRQIGQYEIKIQELLQRRKTQTDEAYSAAMMKLKATFSQIIREYALEHDIKLIIDKSQAVYVSDAIDITDVIIKTQAMDKKLR